MTPAYEPAGRDRPREEESENATSSLALPAPWRLLGLLAQARLGRRGRRSRAERLLTWKLDLTGDQVAAVARILERLKIERAQAEVEQRRSASALADAMAAETFDAAAASVATEHRATSARNVQAAVANALGDLHATLEPDQRRKLAMLIRTRAITF